jgi:hypothetical protein
MTVQNAAISRHEVPPGVAVAVTRPAAAAVDANGTAVSQMAMGRGAPELGNIGAANVGVAPVDRHDEALTRRL